MKTLIILITLLFSLQSFCQLSDSQIRNLKTRRVNTDSSYVYWLPYEKSNSYLFIQGANSKMSHKGELSFDFKMKRGSKICAARGGKILNVKTDSDKGGLKDEYLSQGNHIMIQHDDGSIAQYWHLEHNGAYVKYGDLVRKGQVIGLSGNTGYTAFPHLHFQIIDGNGKEVLPRFLTKKGIKYLRPGRWYKAVNI